MKPEVQAAIESRRQWFWVWVVGVCGGLGISILVQILGQNLLANSGWNFLIAALVVSGLILFIRTLRLQKALLAWTVFIGATCAIVASLFFALVEAMMG